MRCVCGDAWELATKIYKLKMEDKATFYSPSEEWIILAASTKLSIPCMLAPESTTHSLSLGFGGEVQAKEEATVYVRELDLFVTVMLLKIHRQFFHLENSAKNLGTITYLWTRNHISSNMARKFIVTHQIMNHSSYLVYPRVPLPHQLHLHLHRRKL